MKQRTEIRPFSRRKRLLLSLLIYFIYQRAILFISVLRDVFLYPFLKKGKTEYMNLPLNVTPKELTEVLLNVAPIRPVFIWGAPGIGKSSLVEQFAEAVGLPCISLLGSQLAPEDIIGIPQVRDGVSEFLPPKMIARKEPFISLPVGVCGGALSAASCIRPF